MQFARRNKKKTDYGQRLALLKSNKRRLVVRRTSNCFHIQLVEFHMEGDRTLLEMSSSALKKHSWKGHLGNVPAAYLAGLMFGKELMKAGVKEAVPDLGLQVSVKGSSLYACLLGIKDAGIEINVGKEILPQKERIEGRHIAGYAEQMRGRDSAKYARHFSGYIKKGIEPEKLPAHFDEIRKSIMEGNK